MNFISISEQKFVAHNQAGNRMRILFLFCPTALSALRTSLDFIVLEGLVL